MVLETLVPVLCGVLGGCANNLYSIKTENTVDRVHALANIGIGAAAGVVVPAMLGLTGPVGLGAAFLVGYGLIDLKDLLHGGRDTVKAVLTGS